MSHKLLLTSLLAFFPVVSQLPLGMCVAFLYAIIILESRPYFRKGDDRLHLFAQVEIFLLLEAGYVYRYNNTRLDRKSDVVVSIFLIGVVLGFLGVFVTQTFNIVHKVYKRWKVKPANSPSTAKRPMPRSSDVTDAAAAAAAAAAAGGGGGGEQFTEMTRIGGAKPGTADKQQASGKEKETGGFHIMDLL